MEVLKLKVLILTDVEKNHSIFHKKYLELLERLKGNDVLTFDVRENKVLSCLSCYRCWVEHPGVCHIKDDFDKFTNSFYSSDMFIIFTKIYFGCYSSAIKRYMERLIINMLPFFEERDGKMYHAKRYSKVPQYIMIGYSEMLTQFEKTTFCSAVKKNTINLKQNTYKAIVLDKENTYIESGVVCER